jgi:hypothetical protein
MSFAMVCMVALCWLVPAPQAIQVTRLSVRPAVFKIENFLDEGGSHRAGPDPAAL